MATRRFIPRGYVKESANSWFYIGINTQVYWLHLCLGKFIVRIPHKMYRM